MKAKHENYYSDFEEILITVFKHRRGFLKNDVLKDKAKVKVKVDFPSLIFCTVCAQLLDQH